VSGRTPREAVDNYVRPLQRAVSCVSDAVVQLLADGRKEGAVRGFVVNQNESFSLAGPQRFLLNVSQRYEVVQATGDKGPWKVSTRGYQYHLVTADHTEVLLWHWHPVGFSSYDQPHMHAGRAVLDPGGVLTRKAHLPTGRVAIEEMLLLLISDFQVVPRRSDFSEVLLDNLQAFKRYRTWA